MAGFIPEEEEEEPQAGGGFFSSGCEACGCLSISSQFYEAFKLPVCPTCRQLDKYRLIAKGAAKSTYLVTDGDLKRLGYITKPNPRGGRFADMKLYLELQVSEIAMKKHGSGEAIQERKRARTEARIASRVGQLATEAAGGEWGPEEEEAAGDTGLQHGMLPQRQLNPAQQRVWQRLLRDYGGSTHAAGAGGQDGSKPAAGRAAASGQQQQQQQQQGVCEQLHGSCQWGPAQGLNTGEQHRDCTAVHIAAPTNSEHGGPNTTAGRKRGRNGTATVAIGASGGQQQGGACSKKQGNGHSNLENNTSDVELI